MFLKHLVIFDLIYSFKLISSLVTENNVELEILNKNLFQSLRLHPKLNYEQNLTEETKNFIDKYVDNFFDLTVVSLEDQKRHRSKRGFIEIPETITKDVIGTATFSGLEFQYQIALNECSKLEIFQLGEKSFISGIEQDAVKNSANFQIFKMKGNNLTRLTAFTVPSVVKFSLHRHQDLVFFVLKTVDRFYSGMWVFDGQELKHLQNMDLSRATGMEMWSTEDEIHMAVSNFEVQNSNNSRNSMIHYNGTVIYKWQGSYFDSFQVIRETVSKVIPFSCENKNFMILIYNKTNNDYSSEYSEVYRYNLRSGLYQLHQRIPTDNCKDIKFFSLNNPTGYDSYLAVANFISDKTRSEIPPIIYKYVEGYFIPLQILKIEGILEFIPVQSPHGGFLLIARSQFHPLVTFEFDGWMFQQSLVDINVELPKYIPTFTKIFILDNNITLVIGYGKNVEYLEIYQIKFLEVNPLNEFHENMLTWCRNSLGNLKNTSRKRRELTTNGGEEIAKTEEIRQKINTAELILEQLADQIEKSVQKDGKQILGNVEVERVVLNNSNVTSLSTSTINNEIIDKIYENLIDINQDSLWPEGITLANVQVESRINPLTINGRRTEDMVNTNNQVETLRLNIIGKTTFESGVVTHTLNDVPFDTQHILIDNSYQEFDMLNINNVRVSNLDTRKINSRDMNDLRDVSSNQPEVDRISRLETKEIYVAGFINGVDMSTLSKYSLRINGDQNITTNYVFEELVANNVEVSTMSGKNLINNLVSIGSGGFEINQDVQFMEQLTVNELVVNEFLDLIPVVDGKLQVLLKDTEEVQQVSAKKTMNDVELLNQINLQGNIDSEDLDKINPVVTVEQSNIFEGDFEITGNTTVKLLKVNDIKTLEGSHSAKSVLTHGLLLREKEVGIHLNFLQQLNVDEIFIDRVNGINPQSWVVTGTQNQQMIHGAKVFLDDVNITGNTNFFKINDIEISELENTVLTRNGDQVITGKHTILNVFAHRVIGNNTIIGTTPLENMMTTNTDQVISGTTRINGNVMCNKSQAETTRISGNTNGLNFNELVEDTVLKNTQRPIIAYKTFKNFTTNNLRIPNFDRTDKFEMMYEGDLILEEAEVENVHFAKTCNEVDQETFGTDFYQENYVEVVFGSREFDNFVVHGNVYIDSGFLNDVHLSDFERDTVKIDEDYLFEKGSFEDSIYSEGPIVLEGSIESVDLENLVQSNSRELQKVLDKKTFENDVRVFGNVVLEGSVNDFNLNDICKFARISEAEKEIEIYGNAIFTKGPNMRQIFDIPLKNIVENAWFKSKPTTLHKPVRFNNVTLHENVTVKGYVDGVNLTALKTEYFSKTKDQYISEGIYFVKHVNFLGNLVSPKLTINRNINDIHFPAIRRNFLLQDEDQMFEEIVFLEDVQVEDVEGKYTVNDLNLETDLMRFDKDNVVIGQVQVNHLTTENLQLTKATTVQDVDIQDWMRNAILKKGVYNIDKRKIFMRDVIFDQEINLNNSLNGELFTNETIMLKSTQQNITGIKTFRIDGLEPIKFKNVKLKGLLNGMDMSQLLRDQIGDTDLIFKSPMRFHNDISADNLNLRKPYKGIDIEKLLSEVADLETKDTAEKYEKLLNISQRILRNMIDHPYFLESYRELQEIEKPNYVINSCCGSHTLMYFDIVEESCIMSHYYWNEVNEIFVKGGEIGVNLGYLPLKIEAFSSNRKQFIYMEYPATNYNTDTVQGQFWRIDNETSLINYGLLLSQGVSQITPLILDESECLLMLYRSLTPPQIFCDFDSRNLLLHRSLEKGRYLQSLVIKIDFVPFLILLSSHEDSSGKPQGRVEIRSLEDSPFEIRQEIYLTDPPPRSIAAITHKGVHYLSILYRGTQQGRVDILRYSKGRGKFEQLQQITLNNPIKSEFSVLDSGELLLLLLGSPNETLTIYKYLGMSGFKRQITASSIPDVIGFKQFNMDKYHFVMLEQGDKYKILQAQFKGNLKESL